MAKKPAQKAKKKAAPKAAAKPAQLVADAIWTSYATSKPCPPVREFMSAGDIATAYAAQEINTKRWLKAGRRLAGRKIGLTSLAVQKQLGVDQPDYGMLYADMAVPDGGEVARSRLIQPRVEAEITFVMGRDLDHEEPTVADVIRATEFIVPSIEIVDSRIADWKISILDTIADNASSGLFVLGCTPKKLSDVDLRLCGMIMESKGEEISAGAGAACLGNPLNAVVWLARTMARAGRPLREGDIVMSGALGPMVGVRWGEVVEARIGGLGSVRVGFAKE